MGRKRRSEQVSAGDCSWEFAKEKGLLDAIASRCRKVGREQGIDAEDLFQETLLYIASRPGWECHSSRSIIYAVLSTAEYVKREQQRNSHETLDDEERGILPPLVGISGV